MAWLWLMTERLTGIMIHIACSVKNIWIAINIFQSLLNYNPHIFLFSALQGVLEGALRLLVELAACANMSDCKSPAPVRHGSWVTVCVSCVFYLSSRSSSDPSSSSFLYRCVRGEGWSRIRRLLCRATFLCNAEEPHSYLSLSLHLLELATSHFTSDPSINS